MGSIPDKLQTALAERWLVRIERSPQFAERVDGFVVGLGAKWLLLSSEVDGGHANGYLAIRLKDIKRVQRDRSFAGRVARSLPSWPPTAPAGIALDSTAALVTSAGLSQPLIGIERQRLREAMWIGQYVGVDGKRLWMHELDIKAKWSKKPAGYKLGDITSITFGDRYLASLALVAGQPRVAEPVT